jgi:hypothetical protein
MDNSDELEQNSNFNFMSDRVYDNYHVFYAGSISPHNGETHCLYRSFLNDDYYKFDINFNQSNGGQLSMLKANHFQQYNYSTTAGVLQSNSNFSLSTPRIYSFTHGLASAGSE